MSDPMAELLAIAVLVGVIGGFLLAGAIDWMHRTRR